MHIESDIHFSCVGELDLSLVHIHYDDCRTHQLLVCRQ